MPGDKLFLADLIPHFAARPNLLIGQAPQRDPKTLQPDWRPWDSDSGRRLAKKIGISHEWMMELFDTANLNPVLLGTKGKYDVFDRPIAKQNAQRLKIALDLSTHRYHLIVCAGKKVAELMNAPWIAQRKTVRGDWMIGIPHPGGTNRYWNDAEKAREANELIASLYLEL